MFDTLKSLHDQIKDRRILSLFDDPQRAEMFRVEAEGMVFDYSKTQIDGAIREALVALTEAADLPARDFAARRAAMFAGAPINETEGRAVLHWALRAEGGPVMDQGRDAWPEIRETRARMARFAKDVRAGRYAGQGGAITDVVNIGIGGSDLGPAMAARALLPYADGPRVHFVSNVDGADLADTLAGLDPGRTLVLIASKTFTTIETMTNARTTMGWLSKHLRDPSRHLVALSSAGEKAAEWGIPAERVFGFGDYVGGRYSVWGPIGLSLMMAIGPDRFDEFLAGARAMDAHFQSAPPAQNMPVMLALTGIWHRQICGYPTRAVLPYLDRLARLPAYLQQLEMESNGKSVAMDGAVLDIPTGPVVWGEPGTNGQHAFYQLIHQGTQVVPCEFILAARGHEAALDHHQILLLANGLAQSEALMRGRSLDEARALMAEAGFEGDELARQAAHRVFPGDRPSTTLVIDQLTPRRLGQIIALYEHRVFVEGVILGINSFDQWGVELGKVLAREVEPLLTDPQAQGHDPSTRALAATLREMRGL